MTTAAEIQREVEGRPNMGVHLSEARISEEHSRLMTAIAENREALRRIVRAYQLSEEEAEDVLQEVCLAALNKLPTIRSYPGFLFAVTFRKCIQRKRKLHASRESLRSQEFWNERAAEGCSEADLNLQIEIRKLWRLLDQLPRTQGQLLRLWLEGRDAEEIASSLRLSPESIRKIRRRGIERLRALLVQGEEE